MHELVRRIPDVEVLLALEPEEVAMHLLFALKERHQLDRRLHQTNFVADLCRAGDPHSYAVERQDEVYQAFNEAWAYLENMGLLVHAIGQRGNDGWRNLSRRAMAIGDAEDANRFRAGLKFPTYLIHPQILDDIWPLFLRGNYAAAVFQAMREVEIETRALGGFTERDIGVSLMRAAFHHENGPLRDVALPVSEREALSNLFTGAIGLYKNPHSHRHVELTDPTEAMEMIMLASQLLRILDTKRPGGP